MKTCEKHRINQDIFRYNTRFFYCVIVVSYGPAAWIVFDFYLDWLRSRLPLAEVEGCIESSPRQYIDRLQKQYNLKKPSELAPNSRLPAAFHHLVVIRLREVVDPERMFLLSAPARTDPARHGTDSKTEGSGPSPEADPETG